MRTTLFFLPVCISFAFLSLGAQACRPPVVSPIKYQTLTATTPNIHDVTLQHIEASGATHAGIISGLPEAPLKNIHLESVHITAKTGLQSRYVSGW
ncbi:hypothetical protein AAGW04_04345 [Pectobacterium aroidearum]|uniref:hypothetical protein n=1 Tax=Pectobacterium aroidearum TaxID=1201031 RepID=UPI003159595A